ncbi:MAG: FixH family protein [Thermomonas sp.]
MNDQDTSRSPLREPLVWLVFGIPAIAVVALVWMVFIAAGPGSTDSVDTSVKRTAQIQVVDLGPDEAAARLRLAALLRIDGKELEVLPLHAGFDTAKPVRLALRHPTRADLDHELLMQPAANGWRAPLELDIAHDWTLELAPQDGEWRLRGRLPRGQSSARLQPVAPG